MKNNIEGILKIFGIINEYPLKEITNEIENEQYLKIYNIISNFCIDNPGLTFLTSYLNKLSELIEDFELKQNYLE